MRKFSYTTQGTCAARIDFEIDDANRVHNAKFIGGCAGNSRAIASLVEGQPADEVINRLQGIPCRGGTSCPDQFAKALKKVLANPD